MPEVKGHESTEICSSGSRGAVRLTVPLIYNHLFRKSSWMGNRGDAFKAVGPSDVFNITFGVERFSDHRRNY